MKGAPKLSKMTESRLVACRGDGVASILKDGTPLRLTGQDSERGTFAHRNLVLHDSKTGDEFIALHHLADTKASFAVHNSPLSEGSVLGFEYGYNVSSPETMVIWEAQFGDLQMRRKFTLTSSFLQEERSGVKIRAGCSLAARL
ncbi:hypothetical protein PO124_03585 [Bacillus licheniformis]|nr:hypothetical protein [Bacillus licheniformis]